jgi:serine/threonine protein kinase
MDMTVSTDGHTMTQNNDDTAYRIFHPFDAPPIIEIGITRPQRVVVLPAQDPDEMLAHAHNVQPQERLFVDVMKAHNATQAYMRIKSKRSKSLDHHAPGWGMVYFGVILPQVEDGVFQCPKPEECKLVAIKRLSKSIIRECLKRGHRENPYKEIQLMQTLGDNHHVLGMVEALEDDHHLYIIMPYCERESLVEWIPWRRGIHEDESRVIFRNILENMIYLHQRGVCHRDLSPDNCMVLNDRVVFNDLAMSIRIPRDGSHVSGQGGFGKPAYIPPEVCLNLPFHPAACDLWGAAVILFNLVTGEIAWTEPMPGNLIYRYFVLARGLARNPANERTVEILMEEPDASPLKSLALKCLALSPELLDLLSGVLQTAPHERWDTQQVVNCEWVQNDYNWTP